MRDNIHTPCKSPLCRTILSLLLMLLAHTTYAQSDQEIAEQLQANPLDQTRISTRATSIGIGPIKLQDTYLSPEEYTGIEFRLHHEAERLTRLLNNKVVRQTMLHVKYATTRNRADNNTTASGLVAYDFALQYNLPLSQRLELRVGPVGELAGGFTYNMRNGNNPATLQAYGSVGASVALRWRTSLWHRSLLLRYQANAPLVGLMFMPHYGQSYYEIFSEGHSSGTIKVTTPFSTPSAMQMISADYRLGKRLTMRLAYQFDARQASLNSLKTHQYSHIFMIGLVRRLYRL